MTGITQKEEKIMFHTLGYDYQPRWNDDKGGYRNWFGTYPNTVDYPVIQSLIEKGYMQKDGITQWGNEEVFSVTDKGISYVTDLWKQKKKDNKPSRSKRRYEAYFDWLECIADGNFKDYLMWLKIDKEEELYFPEKYAPVREFKKRWDI